jgi:hypothetical protein
LPLPADAARALAPHGLALSHTLKLEEPLMKVRNLFAIAAVGVVGLVADTASAQVNVTPGGATVTGPAGNNLNVPFNGQTPSVTTPGATTTQPGTSGTFTPGTQPGTFAPGASGYYPGTGYYPGSYAQPMYGQQMYGQQMYGQQMYGTNSYYQQPYMNGYSYYTPGQQMTTAGGYLPQQAVAGGGCCGASVMPVSYNAGYAGAGYGGGCCGSSPSYSQPAGYAYGGGGGCGCDPCSGGKHRRGLFRR